MKGLWHLYHLKGSCYTINHFFHWQTVRTVSILRKLSNPKLHLVPPPSMIAHAASHTVTASILFYIVLTIRPRAFLCLRFQSLFRCSQHRGCGIFEIVASTSVAFMPGDAMMKAWCVVAAVTDDHISGVISGVNLACRTIWRDTIAETRITLNSLPRYYGSQSFHKISPDLSKCRFGKVSQPTF